MVCEGCVLLFMKAVGWALVAMTAGCVVAVFAALRLSSIISREEEQADHIRPMSFHVNSRSGPES